MRNFWGDFTFSWRLLRRNPAFAAIAILTVALGIGVNTALFSIVDWLLLRPLQVPNPGQLTYFTIEWKNRHSNGFSFPDFADMRSGMSDVFSDVAAFDFGQDGLTYQGKTDPIWTGYVTGNFFRMCGIQPLLGRFVLPSEGEMAGSDPVLVLGYNYWATRFGSDPDIVGKTAAVNGQVVTIIGVTPRGFHGISNLLDIQGYLPLGMKIIEKGAKPTFSNDRADRSMLVLARLKPGTSLVQARPVAQLIGQRLASAYPEADGGMKLHVWKLMTQINPNPEADPTNALAGLFLGLALLVLLLASLNVANMLLVRAASREREMAVRAALGAPRARLLRLLLSESVLLAGLGCIGGMVLGLAASRSIGSMNLRTGIPLNMDFRFDWRVFAYALAIAVTTAIVAGIAPALRAMRMDVSEMLHGSSRSATAGRQRLRGMLVVAQVAGSLSLLIVAGLFTRSLQQAQIADLGFDPMHVMNFSMDPHDIGYSEAQGRVFYRELLQRVRAMPGAESAAVAATIPASENELGGPISIEGRLPEAGQPGPSAGYNFVSSQYFETMGIKLLHGRGFADADETKSQLVAVINQSMADKYWPEQDPIGHRFAISTEPKTLITVVGVARNSKTGSLLGPPLPFFYAPITQHYSSALTLQVRALGAPEALTQGLMRTIQTLAPTMPVFGVETMTQALDSFYGLFLLRFAAGIAATLGILGLVLATIGLYGVVSYAAAQRTREIGIRMALGASRSDVLRMICRKGAVIIGIGLAVGLILALGIGRVVGSFLIGVTGKDPITFVGVSAILALVGLAASYLPSRRAASVNPMVALRHE